VRDVRESAVAMTMQRQQHVPRAIPPASRTVQRMDMRIMVRTSQEVPVKNGGIDIHFIYPSERTSCQCAVTGNPHRSKCCDARSKLLIRAGFGCLQRPISYRKKGLLSLSKVGTGMAPRRKMMSNAAQNIVLAPCRWSRGANPAKLICPCIRRPMGAGYTALGELPPCVRHPWKRLCFPRSPQQDPRPT
jgi:hypothetical protein